MEFKFIPYSMYAEGYVTCDEMNQLEKYVDLDILSKEYQSVKSNTHNFMTTSDLYDKSEDNVRWEKYKNILEPYAINFIQNMTDNVEKLELNFYFNWCVKNSFIAPHYDYRYEGTGVSFMMLYCPKKYNETSLTTYQGSEKYFDTFMKYEKMPLVNGVEIHLKHERGKFFIVPTNLLHWVTTINSNIDRISLMCKITPVFK